MISFSMLNHFRDLKKYSVMPKSFKIGKCNNSSQIFFRMTEFLKIITMTENTKRILL